MQCELHSGLDLGNSRHLFSQSTLFVWRSTGFIHNFDNQNIKEIYERFSLSLSLNEYYPPHTYNKEKFFIKYFSILLVCMLPILVKYLAFLLTIYKDLIMIYLSKTLFTISKRRNKNETYNNDDWTNSCT